MLTVTKVAPKTEPYDNRYMAITPEIAAYWLTKRAKIQRPIVQHRVRKYAADMSADRWQESPDSIAFDRNGELINGQHRLEAVIMSGTTITASVQTGMDPASYYTIDHVKPRTLADVRASEGKKYYTARAGAERWIYRYRHGKMLGNTPNQPTTDSEIIAWTAANEDGALLDESCVVAFGLKHILPTTVGTFCYYICATVSRKDADAFFEMVKTGENLTLNHPALTLRNRMIEGAMSFRGKAGRGNFGRKLMPFEMIEITLMAWNFYRAGEDCSRLVIKHHSSKKFTQAE